MPSVLGLLEERELGARQRVETLREEAERILAELREAEMAWERFVITRETMSEVLAAREGADVEAPAPSGVQDAVPRPEGGGAVAAGSAVPVWHEGLEVSALSPDYQRIVRVMADGELTNDEAALSCKEIASVLGVELVAAKVEGLRSKANRLAVRGWLVKDASGRFRLADGLRGGGS
jgi:hypothetical protein